MEKAGLAVPALDEQQAADLFAFFYAFRYFEQPGDAARGRRVFEQKLCASCHGIERSVAAGAPPVAAWKTLSDSIALAGAMWNHAAPMREAMATRKVAWPQMTAQEMTDLVIYLRNLPQTREEPPQFAPAAPETGAILFKAKGCAECHQGSLSLESRSKARTTADFAAAMWNHSPKMLQLPPDLDTREMRRLVGYLWSIQFFEQPGNAARGEKVFQSKNCAACHNASAAPLLKGRGLNSISIASALWRHGPSMLAKMRDKNIKWPRFRDQDMSDLLAYLAAAK
jgi:cytochrome c2